MSGFNDRPTCWIIAGPNGAGKTTFALEYLLNAVGCRRFVNADLIAAGMSPLAEKERVSAGTTSRKRISNGAFIVVWSIFSTTIWAPWMA